jgi:hypothetical protein
MKTLIICLFFVCSAHAQTFGLHTVSAHNSGGLNNSNQGAYARFDNGATFGALRNSFSRTSIYAAWTIQTAGWHNISMAVSAGGITGYQKRSWAGVCRNGYHTKAGETCYEGGGGLFRIMAVPSIAYDFGTATVRLGVIPRPGGGSSALHFMVESHI